MSDEKSGSDIALERIAREAVERTGFLDLGRLGLTELPDELFRLTQLRRLNLGSHYRCESGEWHEAASNVAPNIFFGCSRVRLIGLPNLVFLSISATFVTDLASFVGLSNLQDLDCSGTLVKDLVPLAALANLRRLDCSFSTVTDLAPLARLSNLEILFCYLTRVADLAPLAGLTNVWSLNCSSTIIADLTPLAGLTNLEILSCSHTRIADLAPLAGLTNVRRLDCSSTKVVDLTPLAGLTNLERLNCSSTKVADLAPLTGLTTLQSFECHGCRLIEFPRALLNSEVLERLGLNETRIPGVPSEALSQHMDDNCLESLRAHFRDLDAGAVATTDVKLVVVGNGRVGKTQICRRLRNEDYDDTIPSTHGIKVGSASLPMRDGEAIKLHIWDFGGQDIYHGTHALFMKTNAVFMIVWTPEMEDPNACDSDGFRNYPLSYWVDYVRHLGGKDVPVLVVQTRCDRPIDRAVCPVPTEKLHETFDYHPSPLHYSAANNEGRAGLDEALQQSVRWLHERQSIAMIGAGRQRVKLRLETMRDADAERPVDQRQYRTISQEHFRQICDEENGTSNPRHLLAYLHNVGIVFYQKGLFDDSIVLDQRWALDAIYAVFDREKCVNLLRQHHGRFTRSLLEVIVWQGYKPAEQELFLDMMRSCGICFIHKWGDDERGIEPEYIAPDLLPEKSALAPELAEKWDASTNFEEAEWEFGLLHQGLIRAILSRIGDKAGVSAIYWQGGLCVFETTTRSHALIEQEIGEGWAGGIRLQTQSGQATALLERLADLIDEEIRRLDLAPRAAPQRRAEIHAAPAKKPPPLDYASAPRSRTPRFYVSYAWNDPSPEGKKREEFVDRLCAEAEARGTPILRDKTTLKVGDSIARFMKEIGRGDRVFVILSDKYLRSPYCMFELFEIWRNSGQEEKAFLQRCKVFCLDDARFGTIPERLHYAKHWKTEHDQIEAMIKEQGISGIATRDLDDFKLMQQFASQVGDILRMFADRVQPRTFAELEKYGFDEPPGAQHDI